MGIMLYLGILPVAPHGFIHAQPISYVLQHSAREIFQMKRQFNCSFVSIRRQIPYEQFLDVRTYAHARKS